MGDDEIESLIEPVKGERTRPATFSPYFPRGVVDVDDLAKIVEELRAEGARKVKLTGEMIFVWDSDEKPEGFGRRVKWEQSVFRGDTVRGVKMCSAETFCQRYKRPVLELAGEIDRRFRGLSLPSKFAIGVAGCRRSCSEPVTKDIGVIARPNGYEILVGGTAGFNPMIAKSIGEVSTAQEVLEVIGRTIEFVKKRNKTATRLGAILNEIGDGEFEKEVLKGIRLLEPED